MAKDTIGIGLRKLIIEQYKRGKSQIDIVKQYELHKSTVCRIIRRYKDTGTVEVIHKGGRPRKTTSRQDTLMARYIKKNPFVSSAQLVKSLELPIAARSVRRRAVEAGLFARRPAKKPLISKKNQCKRLEFAKQHVNWTVAQWKNVFFTDESKFNLFGSDGKQTVRRPAGKRLESKYVRKTVKHYGGNIVVWGGFSYAGPGPIHLIEGIMDSFMYQAILNDVMLPYVEEEMPLRWTLVQDNDPKHTSRSTKQWLSEHSISTMDWPPQSPDLNPIENLWDIADRQIDRENVRNKHQLFEQVQHAWQQVPMDTIHNLIESMSCCHQK